MKKILLYIVSLFFLNSIAFSDGHSIPKSGTFSWHTGWAGQNINMVTIGENHIQGMGIFTGAVFNDSGKGALHRGAANCVVTFEVKNGVGDNKGYCSFGDESGDMIFTSFTGDTIKGTNIITGGTGKYAGITGSGPWECKDLGKRGENLCNQSLTYELP